MSKYDILLVDDNIQLLDVIGEALEDRGYHVTKVSCGDSAIDMLLKRPYGLVITDFNMDRGNGFDVLEKSKATSPKTPVMIITGNNDPGVYDGAMQLGADDFMWKPFDVKEFWGRVANWMGKSEQNKSARKCTMVDSPDHMNSSHVNISSCF